MQVEPTRLAELAEASEGILATMADDWDAALPDLAPACDALGDAAGAFDVATSYAASLADAGEVVAALAETLGFGIACLVDAAQDALRADDDVATELDRAAHQIAHHVAHQGADRPQPGTGGG